MVRIHLPLSSGGYTQVNVTPSKRYNGKTGEELIRLYGKRASKIRVKTSPITILSNDVVLCLPTGELPDVIKLGDRVYKTRKFMEVIEEALNIRLISKRKNQALKHMQNTSIRLPIRFNQYQFEPIQIIGKENTYLLTPK